MSADATAPDDASSGSGGEARVRLDLEFLARSLLLPKPERNVGIASVVVDSRRAGPGSLFVAAPGQRVDGHDFVGDAIDRGAVAVLAQRAIDTPADVPVLVVKDAIDGLRAVARAWRRAHSPVVIAVAGSAGKSTTKELLAALARAAVGADAVLATHGSENGFIGIPLTLLRLRARHRVAVIEIGIDEPDAMAGHLDAVEPHHAIVTSVGPEHLEQLGTIEVVAREESLPLRHASARQGWAAYPATDPALAPRCASLGARALPYTLLDGAAAEPPELPADRVRAESEVAAAGGGVTGLWWPAGAQGELSLATPIEGRFVVPLAGRHNAQNLLGAIALAHRVLDVDAAAVHRALSDFQPLDGRSQWRQVEPDLSVLCDYYNSSPGSAHAALDALAQLPAPRRVAVLGDMRELGTQSAQMHRDLGPALLRAEVDLALLVGDEMAHLAESLRDQPSIAVHHFTDVSALCDALGGAVRSGDAVLIKGSRGVGLELAWQALAGGAVASQAVASEAVASGEVPAR